MVWPNPKAPLPQTLAEVAERQLNLQFANKTAADLKLLRRFNEVAALMAALERLPKNHAIRNDPAFKAMKQRHYLGVPRIVAITRPEQAGGFDGSDFSSEAIRRRAEEGYAETDAALKPQPQRRVTARKIGRRRSSSA